MINSSFLDVTTPQKEYVLTGDVTPTKVSLGKRFCPSGKICQKIFQMTRVHSFLRHEELQFFDLRSLDVSLVNADKISRTLQGNIDVPDVIKRMEEVAVQRKYFTNFLSKYIAEEYSIQKTYSFTAIALIHYVTKKGVTVEEAVTELLELSSNKSICKVCCQDGISETEKDLIVKVHNFEILRTICGHISDSEKDISASDDSADDPEYKVTKSCSSSDKSKDVSDIDIANSIVDFNPFDTDSSDEDGLSTGKFTPRINSTMSFNPFNDEDSSDTETTQSTPKGGKIECPHCKSSFSNRNNMKQHLVRRVLI